MRALSSSSPRDLTLGQHAGSKPEGNHRKRNDKYEEGKYSLVSHRSFGRCSIWRGCRSRTANGSGHRNSDCANCKPAECGPGRSRHGFGSISGLSHVSGIGSLGGLSQICGFSDVTEIAGFRGEPRLCSIGSFGRLDRLSRLGRSPAFTPRAGDLPCQGILNDGSRFAPTIGLTISGIRRRCSCTRSLAAASAQPGSQPPAFADC